MRKSTTYHHKDYTYSREVDKEYGDRGQVENQKIWHHVTTPSGERIHFDCSPYHEPTETEFIAWVDLGCPVPAKGNFSSLADIITASQQIETKTL